jgi:hypothetical protein
MDHITRETGNSRSGTAEESDERLQAPDAVSQGRDDT